MTNGEKILTAFPNATTRIYKNKGFTYIVVEQDDKWIADFDMEWWNTEYKEPTTKNDLRVECISRKQVIQTIQRYGVGCFDADEFSPEGCERFVIAKLNKLPSVTPIRPKGHWIDGHCSECGCDVPAYIVDWKWQKDMDAKFCPNCGADMRDNTKCKAGNPIEGNNESYNCENWIP